MMKKRLLAAAMTGMMALSTIMAMPMTTNARTLDLDEQNWYYITDLDFVWEDSGIPIVVTSSNDNVSGNVMAGYANMDDIIASIPDGSFDDYPEEEEFLRSFAGHYYYVIEYDTYLYSDEILLADYYDDDDYDYEFYNPNVGDSFTVMLPFTGTFSGTMGVWDDDCWTVSFGNDSITLTCTEETWGFELYAFYKFLVENARGNFWFAPMETELAIAASTVNATGGTATAKASGDFALSYDIMKFLDDHPGVTLEYTMTYEGNEYLLVIPGGSQLANPEIPWYGPKYLIPLFAQN